MLDAMMKLFIKESFFVLPKVAYLMMKADQR